jgi:hypothetical protein
MNINRHNYEEFFILYMDNELSSDERRMVEAFIQNNPDLKDELDSLLQYKLEPDTNIFFAGKEELIKVKGETPVSLSNYEEWLVLYMDNELTAGQRTNVEQFIAANPSLKKEVDLLLQTQLQSETIVFANKELLYRKEEKVRPLLPRWWRAAAAVVLFTISLTAFLIMNNKPSGDKGEVVIKENSNEKKNVPAPLINTPAKENQVAVVQEEKNTVVNSSGITNAEKKEIISPAYKQTNNPVAITPDKKTIDNKTLNNIIAPLKKDVPVMVDNNNRPSNNLPQPENNLLIKKDAANMGVANVNTLVKQALTDNAVTSNAAQPSNIIQAGAADDAAFNQAGGKKNKLRGFFRKVTRTFEKRTNIDATDGEDRLLVAGLAFKTK